MKEEWRKIVCAAEAAEGDEVVFVQANTFLTQDGKGVEVREYEESCEGVVRSWAERAV